MLIKNNITVFHCEYCKKKLFRKHSMELHEKWCTYNPANEMKCIGCENLEIIPFEWNNEHGANKSNYFRCKAKEVEMYPIKALKKNLSTKYPNDFKAKVLMPKDCVMYKCELPF